MNVFRDKRGWAILALIAATFSALWCGVVSPPPVLPLFFQAELNAPTPVLARVDYHRGAGLIKTEAAERSVPASTTFVTVRLPLPAGKYRLLRFQPRETAGAVRFRNVRITTFDGHVVRKLSAVDFSADKQVSRFEERDGIVDFETTASGNVPPLTITFNPVLRLAVGFWSKVALFGPRWTKVFLFSFGALVLTAAVWRSRIHRPTAVVTFCTRRPRTALALIALLAASAAYYPVAFFGKSLLSPTSGSLLLYDQSPTIPGFADLRADEAHGADVGAMMWQHFPYTVHQHRALSQATWPLWNRYNSTGVTLLGQGQSMLGDPLHLLVIAARGASWAFDLKFILIRALFACGVGWCAWGLTRDFAAATIAILASAFVAFFNYRLNHPAIFSVGYAPWILVAWLQLVHAVDRRAFRRGLVLWFVANWIVLTSGTVKEAYLLVIFLNATGALLFLFIPDPAQDKPWRTLFVGLTGVAFILATSPLWWSFLHALGTAYTTYDQPRIIQIRREWFVGMFDDLFYREFIPEHNVYQPATNFLVLLGCLCAVLQPRRLLASRGALAVLVGALASIGLAFQWGPPTWSPNWLLHVPLLRNVHHFDNAFSCIAVVHLSVLAGWGFSAARVPLTQGEAGRLWLLMAGILGSLFVPYFLIAPPGWTGHVWQGWTRPSDYQSFVYLHMILLPVSLLALLHVAAHRLRRGSVGAPSVLLALSALGLMLVRHGQHLPFAEPGAHLVTPGTRANLFEASPAIEFLRSGTKTEPGRILGTGTNVFPGFASVHAFEGINGPDALINRHYRELCEAGGIAQTGDWRYEMSASDLPQWRPMLDFLNVRYVAAPPDVLRFTPGYRPAGEFDFTIFQSEHPWPRAFFTNRIEYYDTAPDLVRLIRQRPPGYPFAALQIGDPPAGLFAARSAPSDRSTAVPARDYRLETNRTAFTVTATGPGVVVLHEAWLPGDFRATLNGQAISYFRVNHAFKAIAIPAAGSYRVEFEYWPDGLTLTLLLSVAGFAGFVGLWIGLGRTVDASATLTSRS